MVIPSLGTVVGETDLPGDVVQLARQKFHLVARSASAGQVYRIGLADHGAALTDPCDVGRAHVLATAMNAAGLNVLAPTTCSPRHLGRYVISAFPLAEPLGATGWRSGEPELLGTAMVRWADFTCDLLDTLDIPGYTADRIDAAESSTDDGLRAAAYWCRRHRDCVERNYPWAELAATEGCVHGDPNLGNLVRVATTVTPQFIDLDSVKRGPRWYDLAVMRLYAVRFASNYPWRAIHLAYEASAGPVDPNAMDGLRQWKELSSATQLLTRWQEAGIDEEFWRRALSDADATWRNVTGTLVHAQ